MTVLLGGIEALHAAGYPIEEGTPRKAVAGRGSRAWLPSISRKAAITGGGAALLVAAGFALYTTRAPALDPQRVAVSGFEDHSADPTLAPLGHLATGWVTQALTRGGRVEVVAAAATGHLDPAGIQGLAARTGAGTVVVGSYYRDGDSVRFHVQIVDAVRGTVWRALDPVAAPRRAPLEAADAVRRRVAAVFDTLFAAR